MLIVKVLKHSSISEDSLPIYLTVGSAGADIRSNESGSIAPREIKLVKTGLCVEIPAGYEMQLRPRSGLALKNGITLLNSPATIDSDYRGEIGVILINHSDKVFTYKIGDRIAQLVLSKYEQACFEFTDDISVTDRSDKGFGSTDI